MSAGLYRSEEEGPVVMNEAPAAHAIERDPRWARILARDASADGAFVFAVRTTGVYCRPSCPSRRPKPENVTIFSGAEQAAAAGFRPCRRCRPDDPTSARSRAALIARACQLLETAEEPPRLRELAAALRVSPHHLHRLFRAATGLTPRAWAAAKRAEQVREQLGGGTASVTEAIYAAGYGSSGRFYERSDEVLGMTPTQFRQGGANMEIRFAIARTSLGSVLVASSERGICAITMGDDPELLLRDLQDRFPAAELIGGDAGFEATVAAVIALIERPGSAFDLPLDIRGTAFQRRVWEALRRIPPGQTVTYAEIARRIGMPQAVRAVAGACAANALAVAIPCHRVVRTDGSLSGYRWGIDRKRTLIDREAAAAREPA